MSKDKALKLNKLNYEDIKVGDKYSFEKVINEGIVDQFSSITGDINPLHTDELYASKTQFGGRIAHGMLLGGLFSPLVGMLCPGKKCLYLSQSLNFRAPVKLGEKVMVEGKVISKSDATQTITLKTIIKNEKEKVVVEGEAKVKVGHE